MMASKQATCQQPEDFIPEEVTSVLEEIVMTVETATDNAGRPTNISMLHDYAMEHLFSFLPMSDLKNCRLVNRSWNNVSNQAIQKRKYSIHFGRRYYGPHNLQAYQLHAEDVPKLEQLVRTSFQFPWTKFQVDSGWKTSTNVGSLLGVIHPFVTELEIRNLLNLQSFEYPNLRKLALRYDSSKRVPTGDNWKSLLQMVTTASKLNELFINVLCKAPMFMDILEMATCRKISRLSLSWWIEGKHLVRLSEMGLQLKFFRLVFGLSEVTVESVRAVLKSQSNCLEQLELIRNDSLYAKGNEVDPQWRLGIEFPRMDKLNMLWIQSTNVCRISYKDMFPALKKLKVSDFDDNYSLDDSFFNDSIEPVETVEYLRFSHWAPSPEKILRVARQFPNLRNVSLTVGQDLLKIVGLAMPRLEDVKLVFSRYHNMDSILTGLSSEKVDALKGLPANQLDVVERSREPVQFLKNFKRLRLYSMGFTPEESSLSDFGCRFALLKMEHLQVLELQGTFNQISDQVMEKMRAKFVVRLEN